jgi:hypothetical protein
MTADSSAPFGGGRPEEASFYIERGISLKKKIILPNTTCAGAWLRSRERLHEKNPFPGASREGANLMA